MLKKLLIIKKKLFKIKLFIRNGGGLYELNGQKLNHLFDGLACVHRFEIKDG